MRALLGVLLGVVARLWLATLRVQVVLHPGLRAVADRAWVLSFFHGTQWPLLAWRRRRRTVVLVSLSLDGEMQARALRVLGLALVRGSSSRGGARGLAALVRRMRGDGLDAAFAVDGPRGPYGVVKGGAIAAARASGGVLVPMGSAAPNGVVLARAWDRFVIAWPFSRVVVTLGAPIDPRADEGHAAPTEARHGRAEPTRHRLERAIVAANVDAARTARAGTARAQWDSSGAR